MDYMGESKTAKDQTMISPEEVSRVALLARLSLTDEETKQMAEQLTMVLAAFEHVSKVNTEGVEPLVTPADIEPRWRVDRTVAWESPEVAMANAPEAVGNLFKVPPVVG
jgi:aspartyl-tRNA(Asn)/glutamyl-tRNA(Gln) amidotransferase subunit C